MKKLTKHWTIAISLSALMLIPGCAGTASHGSKIEASKVAQIKKGVTTRAEVEALLGRATSTSMMGDGRRMLFYNYGEASATMNAAIPMIGAFMGDKTKMRNQSLQIIFTKTDVVEDYEFSDNVRATDMNYLRGNSTSTTTPSQPAK